MCREKIASQVSSCLIHLFAPYYNNCKQLPLPYNREWAIPFKFEYYDKNTYDHFQVLDVPYLSSHFISAIIRQIH